MSSLGLGNEPGRLDPIAKYRNRGAIEFLYPTDPGVTTVQGWSQYRTLRRGVSAPFVVRYNRYVYNLSVKGENLDYAQKAPSPLTTAGIIPTSVDDFTSDKNLLGQLATLQEIVDTGLRAEARAKVDSPPPNPESAKALSDSYIELYKSVLGDLPGTRTEAVNVVNTIQTFSVKQIGAIRARLGTATEEDQKAMDAADATIDAATEKSKVAESDLKRANVQALLVAAALTTAGTAATDAANKLEAAVEAQRLAQIAHDGDPGDKAKSDALSAAMAKAAEAKRINEKADMDLRDSKASKDASDGRITAIQERKDRADEEVEAQDRVKTRVQAKLTRDTTRLNAFDTNRGRVNGLITEAGRSAALLYDLAHLEHLRQEIALDPTGDEYRLTLTFAKIAPPDTGAANGGVITPNGTLTTEGAVNKPESRLFPVDFGFFQSVKPSYSIGILYSSLKNEKPSATTEADGTFTIQRGKSDHDQIKPIALLHLNVLKSGQLYTGPCVGVTFASSNNTGYFAGWSLQFGVRDRISLNLGYEVSKVDRLKRGLSYGTGSTVGTSLTDNVYRGTFGVSLTYSFKIP